MQCTAQRKHGKGPCTRRAIEGGKVCIVHGGAAPQVKMAARERIAAMVDPALGVLYRAMKIREKGKGGLPMALAVVAARDVLDRAGWKATDKLVLGGMGPQGEIVITSNSERLKADLDSLHEKLAREDSGTPEPRPN